MFEEMARICDLLCSDLEASTYGAAFADWAHFLSRAQYYWIEEDVESRLTNSFATFIVETALTRGLEEKLIRQHHSSEWWPER